MRRLIGLLLTGLLLLGGCGFSQAKLPWEQEKPRFAVVDWDKLVQQHPKYKEWKHQQETLETAKWLRQRQMENGRQQLELLGKMKNIKNLGADQFKRAQISAKMAEKQSQENDLLRKKREALETEAEAQVKQDREAVEEKYRIPLFNLRLKLGSIKMTEEAQKAVLQEQDELLAKRQKDLDEVNAKKEAWLQQKLGADIAASQARLQAYAKELADQVIQEQTGLTLGPKGLAASPGKEQLDKLLASMDKQIQKQESDEQALKDDIDSDILSAIKKINLTRKYTLIFRNPRVNISADDITDQVSSEVQKIVQ